ncbi:MAG: site-2 protease family protein [Actinomycetes bacterium]
MAKAPHFHLAGVPVRVEASFFVIIVLLGINPYQVEPLLIISWVAIAFVSILLHEFGHALAFRRYGIRPDINLYGMGGMTSGSGDLTPTQSIVVSLAGPLSVLVVVGLPALWLQANGAIATTVGQAIVRQVIWINFWWSILNLLPMLPLDGGNIARSVLDMITKGRGRRPAEMLSIGVAIGAGLLAYANGVYFGIILAVMFVGINVSSLSKVKHDELIDELAFGQHALIEHRPIDAERIANTILAKKPSGPTLVAASELLGWARLWQGDQTGAESAVQRYAHAGSASGAFRAAQALAAGRIAEGIAVMVWAFANEPAGSSQVLGAIAIAGTGHTELFASELLRLGGQVGPNATLVLHGLLNYAGYTREAQAVATMLESGERDPGRSLD